MQGNREKGLSAENSDELPPRNKVYAGNMKTKESKLKAIRLVNLLNGRAVVVAGTAGSASRHTATGHTARHAATLTTSSVELHHDGVGDTLELLLLRLVLVLGSGLVVVQPGNGLVNLSLELLLVTGIKLLIDLGVAEGVAQRVGVRLESVLCGDTAGFSLVLSLVLLSLSQHALDLLLRQAALVVGDDNLVGLSGTLLKSRDVDDTVGVDVEGDLDLRDTTGRRWDAGKLELSEQVVVLRARTLALVDLDKHTRLVVAEGGEDLGLLGGDGGVALDESSHDTASSLDTDGKRRDIEKQDLAGGLGRGVARQDSSLDGSTVGNSLIGVNRLVGLLAVEEVGDHLLDLGDTGRSTDQDDLVDGRLVNLGVAEDTLDGLHGGAEEVLAQLLEAGTGDRGVEVDTLVERVDLDRSLCGRGQSALGPLAGGAKTTEGTSVGGEVPGDC
jgi:hypothetical protein